MHLIIDFQRRTGPNDSWSTIDEHSWQRWLFDRYVDVLTHEGAEMFVIDGERPYAPHHYDGADPYVVFETTRAERLARPGSPDPNEEVVHHD
jgi:hypothetical protein